MRTRMVRNLPPGSVLSAREDEESEEAMSTNTQDDEIARTLAGICNRLDTLASITAENILIPGGPQERYYAALGLIETQVDKLRAEREYQHTRLDEARDAALAEQERER